MKIVRAILAGSIVWVMVFSLFTLLSFVPIAKDSQNLQSIIVGLFLIPFAYLGAKTYYKKGSTTNGFIIGLIMVTSALILDALITVPLVVIPNNGGDYLTFFTSATLWILVTINLTVIHLYWKMKVQ